MSRLSEFGKDKVFWTRKMNMQLVKFIESRPNIWDPKHPKYTSVKLRDETYADFASKYDDAFDGRAVKDRWTNIRSTFALHVRKLNISLQNNKEYKVNWHLWQPCQFLMKVNKNKSDNLFMKEEENEDNDTVVELEKVASDEEKTDNNDSADSNCKTIAENLLHVFKGVQNDAFGLDNTKHGKFGQFIAEKLSRMNSFKAAEMSKKIMDVLLLYDENNPENPNNLSSQDDL